jgi:hypothetical protein
MKAERFRLQSEYGGLPRPSRGIGWGRPKSHGSAPSRVKKGLAWARPFFAKLSALMMHKESQKQDDGERDPDQPKECASAETHFRLLCFRLIAKITKVSPIGSGPFHCSSVKG